MSARLDEIWDIIIDTEKANSFRHELSGISLIDLKNNWIYVDKNKSSWSDKEIAIYHAYVKMVCNLGLKK